MRYCLEDRWSSVVLCLYRPLLLSIALLEQLDSPPECIVNLPIQEVVVQVSGQECPSILADVIQQKGSAAALHHLDKVSISVWRDCLSSG